MTSFRTHSVLLALRCQNLLDESTRALVVIAVHDLNLAARHCDTVMLMTGGALVGHGAFEAVITPDVLRSVYGIEAEFIRSGSGVPVILPLASTSIETH